MSLTPRQRSEVADWRCQRTRALVVVSRDSRLDGHSERVLILHFNPRPALDS